jgi:hypothetical protein
MEEAIGPAIGGNEHNGWDDTKNNLHRSGD